MHTRILFSLLASLVVYGAYATPASALEFGGGEEYTVPVERTVEGDFYVAGEKVRVSGAVEGDVHSAGLETMLEGFVGGDIHALGAKLSLTGTTSGDVRALGSEVVVAGMVGEDLIIAGEVVKILKGAVVKGDVYIFGSYIEIDGEVQGTTTIRGRTVALRGLFKGNTDVRADESLALSDTAVLSGNLAYRAPSVYTRSEGAMITGTTTYTALAATSRKPFSLSFAFGALMSFLLLFFPSIIFVAVFKAYATRVVSRTIVANGRTILTGILAFFLVPIVGVLLCVSMIGLPLGVVLLLLYLLFIGCSVLLSGALAGALVSGWHKKTCTVSVQWTGIGVFVLQVCKLIPLFGWLVSLVASAAVFGALWEDLYHSRTEIISKPEQEEDTSNPVAHDTTENTPLISEEQKKSEHEKTGDA